MLTNILTIIGEALSLGDILTTEIALKKVGGLDERNILWKKDKYRRLMYPLKMSFPLLINIPSLYHLEHRWISLLGMIGLVGILSVVVGNNLYHIITEKKFEKKQEFFDIPREFWEVEKYLHKKGEE